MSAGTPPVPMLPCVPSAQPDISLETIPQNRLEESLTETSHPPNPVNLSTEKGDQPLRKSTRKKRPPAKLQDYVVTN